jgi:iron complex outermembrane receptor protein
MVHDSETLEALPFARLEIEGTEKGAFSDMSGEYRIVGLCDGKLKMKVSHVGCEDITVEVEIRENTHFDITLPHSHSHADSVLIEDTHPEPKSMVSASTLDRRELSRVQGSSLGEALMQVAGVTALQTGPNIFKPMIHGLHGNRILVLNNGIRQEGQQWGSEHGPEIDPFIATRLTVLKGASGVRYGPDAIGGVVLVEPAELPDSAGLGGGIHLAGFSNGRGGAVSGHLEGAFTKLPGFAWRVQGTLRRLGDQQSPAYMLSNTGLSERNFSYAAGWSKKRYGVDFYYSQFNSDLGILAAAHIGNLTDLQQAIGRDTPLVVEPFTYQIGKPRQHIVHELAKVRAWYKLGELWTLRANWARQYNLREEYDITRRNIERPGLQYEVTTHSGEILLEHELWKHLKGQIGLAGQVQKNTYEGAFLIPDYRAWGAGLFWIERLVKLRWEVEAGLRFDHRFLKVYLYEPGGVVTRSQAWSNPSLTLGGLYRLDAHWHVHFNAGTAWRPPAVNELYSKGLHHGAAAVENGDPTLNAEKAINFVASLRYQGHEEFSGELSFHHTRFDGFVYLQPVFPPTLTIRGAFPTFQYMQADARMSGADLSLSWMPIPRINWQVKASALRALNTSDDSFLVGMPADRLENTLGYTFRDWGAIGQPGLSVTLAAVRRQTRVRDEQDYLPAPGGYLRVDCEVQAEIQAGKQNLTVHAGVHNLLNTQYRDYLDRFRYFADAPGRNVMVRITYPFFNPCKLKKP